MSSSKITSIVMYIIVGITVLVMFLFYTGKSLVDRKEYETKVAKIENPSGKSSLSGLAQDLKSADSLSVSADSSALAQGSITGVAGKLEPVSLTFMEKLVYNQTDIPLYWGYVLLIITIITTIAFPIIYIFKHPTNLVRSLIILVVVGILGGLAYSVASGTTMDIPGFTGTVNSNPQALRVIDTGLIFMYFMLGISLLSILYSEISNYFK
jgi:hypothetical protein